MRTEVRFQIENSLSLRPFEYVLYRLVKGLPAALEIESKHVDALLFDFQDIIVERNLLPGFWLDKLDSLAAIKRKTKEVVDALLLPVDKEQALIAELGQEQEYLLNIAALATLLAFNPYQESDVYDVTAWNIHGTILSHHAQDIGPVLLELACHARLSTQLSTVRAFDYYKLALDSLNKALDLGTWYGNDAFVRWTTFSLVTIALKFKENFNLVFEFPYLADYIYTVASEILGFEPDMTESALSDLFIQAINNAPNLAANISALVSTNFLLLNNVIQGNAIPTIPEVETADYLIDENGTVYAPSDFAPVDHEHSEYLRIDQPAANAEFLVDKDGKVYTIADFAQTGHEHSEHVRKDELKDADYLWSPERLYTADDFAERIHTHDQYLGIGQPARAARAFLGELLSGIPLSPVIHEHPELLRPDDIAIATYRLGGKTGNEFALEGHEHPEYITQTQAAAIGERVDEPLNPSKGAKGVYAVLDEPGTAADQLKAVHFVFGNLSFSGVSNVIYAPNIVYAHCTLVGPSSNVAQPVVNYVYDRENPDRIVGVQFISPSNALTQIMYVIAYQPDVTPWLERKLLPPNTSYDIV